MIYPPSLDIHQAIKSSTQDELIPVKLVDIAQVKLAALLPILSRLNLMRPEIRAFYGTIRISWKKVSKEVSLVVRDEDSYLVLVSENNNNRIAWRPDSKEIEDKLTWMLAA